MPNNLYGLMFPIVLDGGAPAKPGLEDSIESSIRVILAEPINGRNFLSPFGTILDSLLGAQNSKTSKNALSVFLKKAISTWEGRIQVNNIDITQEDSFILISINATILETQTNFNYEVYV